MGILLDLYTFSLDIEYNKIKIIQFYITESLTLDKTSSDSSLDLSRVSQYQFNTRFFAYSFGLRGQLNCDTYNIYIYSNIYDTLKYASMQVEPGKNLYKRNSFQSFIQFIIYTVYHIYSLVAHADRNYTQKNAY